MPLITGVSVLLILRKRIPVKRNFLLLLLGRLDFCIVGGIIVLVLFAAALD